MSARRSIVLTLPPPSWLTSPRCLGRRQSRVGLVDDTWFELTGDQRRKPLVGSGCVPTPFGSAIDALLIGSDGLFNYVDRSYDRSDFFHADLGWRLVEAARLPNGELWDDLSAILVRRADHLRFTGASTNVPA